MENAEMEIIFGAKNVENMKLEVKTSPKIMDAKKNQMLMANYAFFED